MGRTLQKKKNRSSVPRATLKPKSLKRPIKASPIVAAHWDKNLTLSQNYRKIGLASKLNSRTGGAEVKAKDVEDSKGANRGQDPLAVGGSRSGAVAGFKTTQVLRDEEGNILKVVHDGSDSNPLNDPLVALEQAIDTQASNEQHGTYNRSTGVVAALEAAAEAELSEIKKQKKPRKQSQREQDWIETLVKRYGDDVRAMARDKKLNSNQQTEADIGRRIKIWKQSNAIVEKA